MLDCSVVIPTYYTHQIILNLLNSLPNCKEVLILDNSNDENLKKILPKNLNGNKIQYYNLGDIGLSRTYNTALEIIKSKNLCITQPDVVLEKNCLENLLKAKSLYDSAALFSPIIFNNEIYDSFMDFHVPPLKKTIFKKNFSNTFEPCGDFCVESINATAILLDKDKIIDIGGWDNYYYTYFEDLDICKRLNKINLGIVKVNSSKVYHPTGGFGVDSFKKDLHKFIKKKKFFNYSKSLLYFKYKYDDKFYFYKFSFLEYLKFVKKFLKSLFLFKNESLFENYYRLKAFYYFFIKENFGKKGNKQF